MCYQDILCWTSTDRLNVGKNKTHYRPYCCGNIVWLEEQCHYEKNKKKNTEIISNFTLMKAK